MRCAAHVAILVAGVAGGAGRAGAADETGGGPARATFALIIGVNQSVDRTLAPLRYADDDAARYHELFRALGARTYLMTRADDNTRRLHPQAVAESLEPREAGLRRHVAQLAADVAQARARHIATTLYVVYAGHGDVQDGEGFISLEDGRLTGARLAREVLGAVRADENHLIVDACHSYYLVFGRGPGGARRPARGFLRLDEVLPRAVGLLFSTSSARESHEWEAFEAGVFSHEVRSGLSGAADVDGDGLVSYREIAAFVERANAAIIADKFRPDVYARPPDGRELFVDLRPGLQRRIEVDGKTTGHLLLEDGRGVRVADFHNSDGQTLRLVRPAPTARGLYLRRDGGANAAPSSEMVIPNAPEVVTLAELSWTPSEVGQRGAAHQWFRELFARPFDRAVAGDYQFRPLVAPQLRLGRPPATQRRQVVGGLLVALAAGALGGGLGLSLSARALRDGTPAGLSQIEIAARNGQIANLNTGAGVLFAALGVAAGLGVTLLVWPAERADGPALTVAVGAGTVHLGGRF